MNYIKTFLIAVIFICYAATISQANEVVKFANGLAIKLEKSSRYKAFNSYRLIDKGIKPLDDVDVNMMNIYKDYAYGLGFGRYVPHPTEAPLHYGEQIYFIYNKNKGKALYFASAHDFEEHLKKIDLPEWDEISVEFDSYGYRKHSHRSTCPTGTQITLKSLRLPNRLNIVHMPTICSPKYYVLNDENYNPIIHANVRYADWHGDYVYGTLFDYHGPERNAIRSASFIYKKGDKKAKIFNSSFEFKDYIISLGLPEWDPHSALFDSSEFGKAHARD